MFRRDIVLAVLVVYALGTVCFALGSAQDQLASPIPSPVPTAGVPEAPPGWDQSTWTSMWNRCVQLSQERKVRGEMSPKQLSEVGPLSSGDISDWESCKRMLTFRSQPHSGPRARPLPLLPPPPPPPEGSPSSFQDPSPGVVIVKDQMHLQFTGYRRVDGFTESCETQRCDADGTRRSPSRPWHRAPRRDWF